MKVRHLFKPSPDGSCPYTIPEAPLGVFLDLTSRCNLQCKFCYCHEDEGYESDVPLDDALRIIDQIGKAGTQEILYLGGEPLLYPHIEEVIRCGKRWNLAQRLITNGQNMANLDWSVLKEAGLVDVGVSLHSHRESLHDFLSGRSGSWRRTVAELETIFSENLQSYVQVSVTQANRGELCLLADFMSERFCKSTFRMDFSRLIPDGRGTQFQEQYLGPEHWGSVFRAIESIQDKGIRCSIEAFPLCFLKKEAYRHKFHYKSVKKAIRPCLTWIAQMPIDSMGNVKLCPTGGPLAGNIFQKGVLEIWNHSPEILTYRTFRWLGGPCVDPNGIPICDDFYECSGGCRRTIGSMEIVRDCLACSDAK